MSDEQKQVDKELKKLQTTATKLGVEFTEETTIEQLTILVDEAKERVKAEKEAEKQKNTPPTPIKTSFDVYNPGGALVRTFTVEIHKENAESLAREYAAKIGGSIK